VSINIGSISVISLPVFSTTLAGTYLVIATATVAPTGSTFDAKLTITDSAGALVLNPAYFTDIVGIATAHIPATCMYIATASSSSSTVISLTVSSTGLEGVVLANTASLSIIRLS
jgi:hypothetical protein